ncbi:Winged helix-like DNA-binding domain superfamily [Sesbania bispinosa]|nr:Winged helix-like DNA-binding domain superfamily [Sesbania bispinosa]
MQGIRVKEEETLTCAVTGSASTSCSSSSSSSSLSPQPMEGLHEMGPPPFLTKTFDVVEDPSTDSIVSWSRARNSFVVWILTNSPLPFYLVTSSTAISPASFAQLNTYGFRKVDPDRWEFANEGFLAGQRQLLKTIKRKKKRDTVTGYAAARLRRDRTVLMAEIVRLRQQQNNSREQLSSMEARLLTTEKKHQQMMTFLAKALSNQTLCNNWHRGMQDPLSMAVPIDSVVDYPSEEQEGLTNIESEMETLLSTAYDNESSSEIKDPASSSVPIASESNLGLVNEAIWEDLLNQDLVAGNPDDEVVIGDLSQVDVPVEDLVAEPDDWTEDLQTLLDHMGYLGSKS